MKQRLLFCLFCIQVVLASAQKAPQWGNLTPGPFKIGFKTLRLTDDTRSYFGAGRPLQLYIWYPAAIKPADKPLLYRAYFDEVGYDWGNDAAKAAQLRAYVEKDFRIASLGPSYPGGIPDSVYRKILDTPLPVYRQASPAAGKYPVLLHAHANGLLHQSVLLEYLASHGYVVVSLSAYGSCPAFYGRGEDGNSALEALTQDLALALAEVRRQLPFANTEKAAVIGMMAQAGLSLQMRDMPLKAIACLDCDWNVEGLKKLPHYDVKKIRVPVMEVVNTEFRDQQFSFLDSLPYAERYIGRYNYFAHADFYPFPKIARPNESKGFKNYEYMALFTLSFLDAVFKDHTKAKAFRENPGKNEDFPAGYMFVRKKEAQAPQPTENEFLAWLRYGRLAEAQAAWEHYGPVLLSKPDNLFFTVFFLVRDEEPQALAAATIYARTYPQDPRSAGLLNRITYDLLKAGKTSEAKTAADTFVELFPGSPYSLCAMAGVLQAMGEKTKAKEEAKKVLDLIEKTSLSTREKDFLKTSAENILYQR